uniref:Uncharacterized protein n=1 Tax=Gossypium raimondii TaxID=29730 RepID=A0A0D2U5K2_GOSRA|nr:hypothetical protein B456_008G218800 [Gossypium raimondii]
MDSRNGGGPVTTIGKRQSDLKKSFKLAVRSLLTTCPTQEFSKAFPKFSSIEQEHLHQLFIQVITSLHGNIEVGDALDTVEQLVEEQSLDPLSSDRTNVMDAVHNLSAAKKAEIHYLRGLLERAEEHNRLIQARVDLLRNKTQEVPDIKDFIGKLRGGILSYKGTQNVEL